MIAKQYLITGIFMGIIGVGLSMLLECNWLGQRVFKILMYFLIKFAPDGVMANDIYLALVTIHGTIMVFCINCCFKWYL
jgi:cytochrome c oxidase subunit 1